MSSSQSHLRRSSKGSSFYMDIEKSPANSPHTSFSGPATSAATPKSHIHNNSFNEDDLSPTSGNKPFFSVDNSDELDEKTLLHEYQQHLDMTSNNSDDDNDEDTTSNKYTKQRRDSLNTILSGVLFILTVGTMINLVVFKIGYYPANSPVIASAQAQASADDKISNQNQLQQFEAVTGIFGDTEGHFDVGNHRQIAAPAPTASTDSPNPNTPSAFMKFFWKLFGVEESNASTVKSKPGLNINAISVSSVGSDEQTKLNNIPSLVNEKHGPSHELARLAQANKPNNDNEIHDVPTTQNIDPQQDLKEILSISPITIIVNEDHTNEQQSKFLQILLSTYTITPEPKVVDLSRHPHYYEVFNYLRSYVNHEDRLVKSSSQPATIKQDIKYDAKKALSEDDGENDDDSSGYHESDNHIPRLFIGGRPIGDYDYIIKSFDQGDLMDLLLEHGKGLIQVV